MKTNQAPERLTKSFPITGFKVLDDQQGIVEAIVSVFGVVDAASERVMPGAFAKSLARKMPAVCWAHKWDVPIGKTLEARELAPGDPLLPDEIKSLGGLYTKSQYNLETQAGREAYSNLKFGAIDEFSIGYWVVNSAKAKDLKGVTDLLELDLAEHSPVLRGCNPATVLMGVKNREGVLKIKNLAERLPECKGVYLGNYIESDMFWGAFCELRYAITWALLDAFRQEATVDDIQPILDEFAQLTRALYTALVALDLTEDQTEAMAGQMARALAEMKQDDPSRADGPFQKQLDTALAAVEGCIERGDNLVALRKDAADDGRRGQVLGEARKAQLKDMQTKIGKLLLASEEKPETKVSEADILALRAKSMDLQLRMTA